MSIIRPHPKPAAAEFADRCQSAAARAKIGDLLAAAGRWETIQQAAGDREHAVALELIEVGRETDARVSTLQIAVDDRRASAPVPERSSITFNALAQRDADLARLAAKRQRLEAEAAAAAEAGDRAAEILGGLHRVLESIRKIASSIPATARLAPVDEREPVPDHAAIEQQRTMIADTQDRIRVAHDAPVPVAAAKAALAKQLDALAAAGRPNVGKLIAVAGGLEWGAKIRVDRIAPMNAARRDTMPDPSALIAWLFRDALGAALEAELDDLAEETEAAALTDEDRAAEIARLEAELYLLEIREEQMIVRLERAGGEIARRPDANPRAVLGLAP